MGPETREVKQAAGDYSEFFHDEEFSRTYPGLKMPPPSFLSSGARIVSFETGKSLTLDFPVRADQTNPIGTLQGGILCSFFDDVFGTLSFASLRRPCITIDLSVNFIRGARPGEIVRIRAVFRSKTRKLLQLQAEAHNEKEKLLATATSNLLVMEESGRSPAPP
jgi:uncharacterized protein (TIGR00369 family)